MSSIGFILRLFLSVLVIAIYDAEKNIWCLTQNLRAQAKIIWLVLIERWCNWSLRMADSNDAAGLFMHPVYSPSSSWPLRNPTYRFCAVVGPLNDFYSIDPATMVWTPILVLGPSPPARAGHGFTSARDKIYLHGGGFNPYGSDLGWGWEGGEWCVKRAGPCKLMKFYPKGGIWNVWKRFSLISCLLLYSTQLNVKPNQFSGLRRKGSF